jgi:hypothetical protein
MPPIKKGGDAMVDPIDARDVAVRRAMRVARIVADQEKLVEQLRADGRPTDEAEAHLAVFRTSSRMYKSDLDAADERWRTVRRRS